MFKDTELLALVRSRSYHEHPSNASSCEAYSELNTQSCPCERVLGILTLYRGLPGAGKSTAAGKDSIAADDFFMVDGVYDFDHTKLTAAHLDCQARCRAALEAGNSINVANTFTQRWEMEPYLQMAEELGVPVEVVDLFDAGLDDFQLSKRNTHGVPVIAIANMRERYEHDWESGDVRPPWERRDD